MVPIGSGVLDVQDEVGAAMRRARPRSILSWIALALALALALLAAGCYRSAPPSAAPVAPTAGPSQPAYYEARATYAHARFHSTRHGPVVRSVIDEAIDRLGEFADEICACTDRACADRVSQELTQWSMELQREHADLKPTEEEMEKASHATERLSKCMMTAMGYGNPSSPPPPPTP